MKKKFKRKKLGTYVGNVHQGKNCFIDGCSRKSRTLGMCAYHYMENRKTKNKLTGDEVEFLSMCKGD